MNLWQSCHLIRDVLIGLRWDSGNQEAIFPDNSVIISGDMNEASARLRTPIAMVMPTSATSDDDSKQIWYQNFDITIIQRNESDPLGNASLLGSPLPAGIGSSRNRGALDIMSKVLEAFEERNILGGLHLYLLTTNISEPIEVENGYVTEVTTSYQAVLTRKYIPHPLAPGVVTNNNVAGTTTINWSLPPPPYLTSLASITIRRNTVSGHLPARTPAQGVNVPVVGTPTSVTFASPGAGTWYFSLFAIYDDASSSLPVVMALEI